MDLCKEMYVVSLGYAARLLSGTHSSDPSISRKKESVITDYRLFEEYESLSLQTANQGAHNEGGCIFVVTSVLSSILEDRY